MKNVKVIFIIIIASFQISAQQDPEFDLQDNIIYQTKIVPIQKVINVTLKNLNPTWSYSIDIDQSRELIPTLKIPSKNAFDPELYNKEIFNAILNSGDRVIIIIIGKKENETKRWEFVLKTKSRGQWVTTFGFTHVFNVIKGNQSFHTSAIDTVFIITKDDKKRENWLDVKPSITFRWFPTDKSFDCFKKHSWMDNWDFSLVGGFGTNLQETNVLLGFGISYNQNISIDFGLTSNQVYTLKSEYSSGQILKNSLTYDELHKKILVINPFVNIAFRLDKNPFSN